MNHYVTLTRLKAHLQIDAAETAYDADLMALIDAASRWVEGECGRRFFTEMATLYFDVRDRAAVVIDDCLALTAVATDSEGDGTYDGEAWTADDYWLEPVNGWPKTLLSPAPWGDFTLAQVARYLKLTGTWGYGNGESAAPWDALGVTVTVANGTATAVTASASGIIEAGMTLLAGTEQMFVRAVSGATLTVRRGVNGTTAAAQATAAASVALYPPNVGYVALLIATRAWATRSVEDLAHMLQGDYLYRRDRLAEDGLRLILAPLRRIA